MIKAESTEQLTCGACIWQVGPYGIDTIKCGIYKVRVRMDPVLALLLGLVDKTEASNEEES